MLISSSCSNVQNREKEPEKSKPSISLEVTSRATTNAGATTETFDKDLEKTVTKALTQVLISGSSKKQLFSEAALADSASSFENNTQATSNKAQVKFNHLASEN